MRLEDRVRILAAAHCPGRHPDTDLERTMLRRSIGRYEKHNIRAKVQPSYPVEEQETLERWRASVVDHIDTRVSCYRQLWTIASETCNVAPAPASRMEHRALRIPELLDLILRYAGPETQMVAWRVSHNWRNSARSVIKCPFGGRRLPDAAIEYGSLVDPAASTLDQPDDQEMQAFSQHVHETLQRLERASNRQDELSVLGLRRKSIYFSARYTQSPMLPANISAILDDLDVAQHDMFRQLWIAGLLAPHHTELVSRNPHLYWLDFTQFKINPYLPALFGTRLEEKQGRIDIKLQSNEAGNVSLLLTPLSEDLLNLLSSMSLTRPPCKAIGIYHSRDTTRYDPPGREHHEVSNKELLVRLHSEQGVTIAEVVRALLKHTPRVLSSWLDRAADLRHKVLTGHWQEDIWHVPGAPCFFLLLDSLAMEQEWVGDQEHAASIQQAMSECSPGREMERMMQIPMSRSFCGHITRPLYLIADDFREERQGEWVPKELMEPSASSIRYPVAWDR